MQASFAPHGFASQIRGDPEVLPHTSASRPYGDPEVLPRTPAERSCGDEAIHQVAEGLREILDSHVFLCSRLPPLV